MKNCIDCGTQFAETFNACPNCGCPADVCTTVSPTPHSPKQHLSQQPVSSGNTVSDIPSQSYFRLDYVKIFLIVAGGIALLGAFIVMGTDTVMLQKVTRNAFVALLFTIGITLIGLGASIKNR